MDSNNMQTEMRMLIGHRTHCIVKLLHIFVLMIRARQNAISRTQWSRKSPV